MAGTPNVQRIESAVLAAFPDARFGRHNCRHISSNPLRSWSQHAGSEPGKYYGNALDITHAAWGYSSHALHQAWLRDVYAFIKARWTVFEVAHLLGPGDRAHSDHVHVDPWPQMAAEFWRTPPCKGGPVIVKYEDGTRGTTYGTVPPPLPPTMGDDMALRRNDTGQAVVHYQEALIAWDGEAILAPWGADGDFGAGTEAAVEKFQTDRMELDQTADWLIVKGTIDGPTAAMLDWYHLIKYGVHALDQPAAVQPVKPHGHVEYAAKAHPHTVPEQTI